MLVRPTPTSSSRSLDTPGASVASCTKLRLLSGSSCTCLESIRFCSAGVGCTSCCAAVTSTTSATPPTVSLPFNSTRSLTCSEMPFTVDVWKPVSVNVTS